jgi:hypothetical protein
MDFESVALNKSEPCLSINLPQNPSEEKDTLSPESKQPVIEE